MSNEKVAIVTGASAGIGRETALRLAKSGMCVALVARKKEALNEMCNENPQYGLLAIPGDVSVAADVERGFRKVLSRFGRVDLLVNAAGMQQGTDGPFEKISEANWNRLWNVNVKGTFLWTRQVLSAMYQRHSGVIVNIASAAALKGFKHTTAYAATKGAIITLTRILALETAEHGVRVSCISPGVVESELLADREGGIEKGKALQRSLASMHPLGRIGQPKDIAEMVVFLASDQASWITGTNFVIDGGLSL